MIDSDQALFGFYSCLYSDFLIQKQLELCGADENVFQLGLLYRVFYNFQITCLIFTTPCFAFLCDFSFLIFEFALLTNIENFFSLSDSFHHNFSSLILSDNSKSKKEGELNNVSNFFPKAMNVAVFSCPNAFRLYFEFCLWLFPRF